MQEAFDRFELIASYGGSVTAQHNRDAAFNARHARSHIELAFLTLAKLTLRHSPHPDAITSAAHNLCRASQLSPDTYAQALANRALSPDARAAIARSHGDYLRCTRCGLQYSRSNEPMFPVITWSGDCEPPTPEQFLADLPINFERAITAVGHEEPFETARRLGWITRQCNSFIYQLPQHDPEIDRYLAWTETEAAFARMEIGQTDPDPVGEAAFGLCGALQRHAQAVEERLAQRQLSERGREAVERARAMIRDGKCIPTPTMERRQQEMIQL